MKRKIKILIALALGLGFASTARAATSGALTVTITPNAFYAIAIDTTNVALNMGTVALAASTQTVSPSTVTIQSTYASTDITLQGAITAGSNPWSFSADSTTLTNDQLAAWATFTTVARSSVPAQGSYFSGTVPGAANSSMVDASARYAGTGSGHAGLFTTSALFDSATVDHIAVNAKSQLWLYFRLPPTSTGNAAQNITLTLTAVAPN